MTEPNKNTKPNKDWKKSSFCGSGTCVEVKFTGISIHVREPVSGGILIFTDREWAEFIKGVKKGEFDLND